MLCDHPIEVEYASSNYTSLNNGSTVDYTCDDNHIVMGLGGMKEFQTLCVYDTSSEVMTWTGTENVCERKS